MRQRPTEATSARIGRNVDNLRRDQGRTVTDLAAALDVSRATMHRRLNGTHPWTADEVEAIAAHLDVDVFAVLDLTAEPA